jgi:hypothetical protein
MEPFYGEPDLGVPKLLASILDLILTTFLKDGFRQHDQFLGPRPQLSTTTSQFLRFAYHRPEVSESENHPARCPFANDNGSRGSPGDLIALQFLSYGLVMVASPHGAAQSKIA